MAEGWAKHLLSADFMSHSAGTAPHGMNLLAVRAMQKAGVDISNHRSKSLEDLSDIRFDLIVTVCENAASSCPIPPAGTKVIHAPFDAPPELARQATTEEQALVHYRLVRDSDQGIRTFNPLSE